MGILLSIEIPAWRAVPPPMRAGRVSYGEFLVFMDIWVLLLDRQKSGLAARFLAV